MLEILVGRRPDRHFAAQGNRHHAGDRQRALRPVSVGRIAAVEDHVSRRRALNHLDPQVAHRIVAAQDVELERR